MSVYYWTDTPKNVGWVERSETQQKLTNVGFRSSTQPTATSILSLIALGILGFGSSLLKQKLR